MADVQSLHDVTRVGEFVTEATVEALNAGLSERGVAPESIITVQYIEGAYAANGAKPQYRVLFRA